ncbi:MAG: hypothetical protein IPJ45_13715 [Ignavibacteria bacterium]|nr:hypothetical protein [Ignavibacteria bacterium]
MLKKLIEILRQALDKPEQLKSKAKEFFDLYHSSSEDIEPEIVDDILMELANDIDYYQWDQESRSMINGEKFNPNEKIKEAIANSLEKINKKINKDI